MNARLALARATQIVLRNALGILGINAPERM
jgi:arginyl-tRNA synthetase